MLTPNPWPSVGGCGVRSCVGFRTLTTRHGGNVEACGWVETEPMPRFRSISAQFNPIFVSQDNAKAHNQGQSPVPHPATSCLGAFRTPAAVGVPYLRDRVGGCA